MMPDTLTVAAGMNLETVLDYYNVNIEEFLDGGEVLCFCPFHDGDSSLPNFQANTLLDIFHCWSCGAAGNYLHFIKLQEPSVDTLEQAYLFFNKIINGEYDLDILKSRFNKASQVTYDSKRDYSNVFKDVIGLIETRIADVYAKFPEDYFTILKFLHESALKIGNTAVYFEWVDPNIENTLHILDGVVAHFYDDVLPGLSQDVSTLYTFYQSFIQELNNINNRIESIDFVLSSS